MGSGASFHEQIIDREQILDHSTVSTLRAVTEAAQHLITAGETKWKDVGLLLETYLFVEKKVKETFKGARVVTDIVEIVTQELAKRNFNGKNTHFAACVCPDELNHDVGNLSAQFAGHWGEVFQLGGLAGIPFPGKTGFAAFSHHVPDNGNLFILFAPHVGVSPSGEFGLVQREGQGQHCGPACGAAIGAFQHLRGGGRPVDAAHLGETQLNLISTLNALSVRLSSNGLPNAIHHHCYGSQDGQYLWRARPDGADTSGVIRSD